ncbi:hypothetical protein BsWGS_15381 [Bradybaena similaris]
MCSCLSSEAGTTDRPTKTTSRSKDSVKKNDQESESVSTIADLQVQMKSSRSKNRHSYVFREDVAEKVAATILKHRKNPHAPVLDLLAGPGLVSRQFLRQGVSRVVALEMHAGCTEFLKAVQEEFGSDRFYFFSWHMVNLYLKLHAAPNSERVRSFLEMESQVADLLLQASSPDMDVPYSLVCLGDKNNNENFVFYIVRNLPNEDPIVSHGHVEFFFLAHPRLKHKVDFVASIQKTSDGVSSVARDKLGGTHFGYIHAFIHLFYDIEVLEQFNADDFCPPFISIKGKQIQDKHIDASKRLLIKMQLKRNVEEILPLQHHTPFLHFLYQVYKKKKQRTIPALEMLIPGSGLRMLAHGFTMMDIIIWSNPEEFVKLYKAAIHWPEFVSSPLHNYMMMKMTGSSAENSLSDDDEHLDNEAA